MNVRQISVFIENSPGTLHAVASILTDNDIHVKALHIMEVGGVSIVRIIVDNIIWTSSKLRDSGYSVSFTDVLVIDVTKVPGGICRILDVMKEANINIEDVYSITGKNTAHAGAFGIMVFEVNDIERALTALDDDGIRNITQEELYAL